MVVIEVQFGKDFANKAGALGREDKVHLENFLWEVIRDLMPSNIEYRITKIVPKGGNGEGADVTICILDAAYMPLRWTLQDAVDTFRQFPAFSEFDFLVEGVPQPVWRHQP